MIIDCISDLHGEEPELEGGDLLIVAGDLTARDHPREFIIFKEWLWLTKQKYKKVILIAGNHDGLIEKRIMMGPQETWNVRDFCYLEDSGTEFCGVDKDGNSCTMKIWGSPWTPAFGDWHFMKDRGEPIKKMWDLIPKDIDILITHGPPFGIQDQVKYSSKTNNGKFAGCEELRNALDLLKKLKLHVFGHVHEGYGKVQVNGVIHVNASIMNEDYEPVNKPIRVVL